MHNAAAVWHVVLLWIVDTLVEVNRMYQTQVADQLIQYLGKSREVKKWVSATSTEQTEKGKEEEGVRVIYLEVRFVFVEAYLGAGVARHGIIVAVCTIV